MIGVTVTKTVKTTKNLNHRVLRRLKVINKTQKGMARIRAKTKKTIDIEILIKPN